jgi:hypothetical protein
MVGAEESHKETIQDTRSQAGNQGLSEHTTVTQKVLPHIFFLSKQLQTTAAMWGLLILTT